jgi:hypothetical protein
MNELLDHVAAHDQGEVSQTTAKMQPPYRRKAFDAVK